MASPARTSVFRRSIASDPKPRRALQVFPSLGGFAPDVGCLGLVSTDGIGRGSRRIDPRISLLLHLDESWCHAYVVDVAEDVLQRLQLLDKAARVTALEQRRKEFR